MSLFVSLSGAIYNPGHEEEVKVTKAFAAPLFVALVFSFSPALAGDCHFTDGSENLYLLPLSTAIAVDPQEGQMPYACSTSSAGTGVAGRMAHCSDGFDGAMLYNEDKSITFRDVVWKPTCDVDAPVLDLMGH